MFLDYKEDVSNEELKHPHYIVTLIKFYRTITFAFIVSPETTFTI